MRTYGIYGEMDFRKESINSICSKLEKFKNCENGMIFNCGQGIAIMLKAILKGLEINIPIFIDNGIRESDIIIVYHDDTYEKIEVDL